MEQILVLNEWIYTTKPNEIAVCVGQTLTNINTFMLFSLIHNFLMSG